MLLSIVNKNPMMHSDVQALLEAISKQIKKCLAEVKQTKTCNMQFDK